MPTTTSSCQPRKQRLVRYNAPLHIRRKQIASHLADNLILRYNRRSIPVVKGDIVRVMRGAFRGHEDKIASVDLKLRKVTVEGVTITKADGKKKARAIDPSNLLITKLNLTDRLRRERIARTAKLDAEQKKKLASELDAEAKAQAQEIEKFKAELAARETQEKEERAKDEQEPVIDHVTGRVEMKPKEEHDHEHAGGEHLDEATEKREKRSEEEKK